MKNLIYPCVTLKGRIGEAAEFYTNLFGEGAVTQISAFAIMLELNGQKFLLLNEGPESTPNTTISFMVASETVEETTAYWEKLNDGGKILMQLDAYPWSNCYGWVEDKFGLSWQVITGSTEELPQKISPSLMFTGKNAGKAREAINYYTDLFPNSNVDMVVEYEQGEEDVPGLVKYGQFRIRNYVMMVMDSSAEFEGNFNDAISFTVLCDTQEEIDEYWEKLTAKGGYEVACGWLVDKYGLSWQIIPSNLMDIMKEPERAERVMQAFMKMKKMIKAELESA